MNTISATYGALRAAIVHAAEHAQAHAHEDGARAPSPLSRWISPRDHHDARARAAADHLAVYPSGWGR